MARGSNDYNRYFLAGIGVFIALLGWSVQRNIASLDNQLKAISTKIEAIENRERLYYNDIATLKALVSNRARKD